MVGFLEEGAKLWCHRRGSFWQGQLVSSELKATSRQRGSFHHLARPWAATALADFQCPIPLVSACSY